MFWVDNLASFFFLFSGKNLNQTHRVFSETSWFFFDQGNPSQTLVSTLGVKAKPTLGKTLVWGKSLKAKPTLLRPLFLPLAWRRSRPKGGGRKARFLSRQFQKAKPTKGRRVEWWVFWVDGPPSFSFLFSDKSLNQTHRAFSKISSEILGPKTLGKTLVSWSGMTSNQPKRKAVENA